MFFSLANILNVHEKYCIDGCHVRTLTSIGLGCGLFTNGEVGEKLLVDSSNGLGIIAPQIHIGTYQVTVNYIGASTTTEAIGTDIGSIVGVYWAIVDQNPEVGDLLITIEDINGNAIATLTCQKDWVRGVDINDASEAQRIALKVLLTIKTV